MGSNSARVLNKGFNVVVGNGERARLWSEFVWDSIPLKYVILRIFGLVINNEGLVKDYGQCLGSKWS